VTRSRRRAIVRAPETGWTSAQTWLTLAAAAVLLAGFVAIQARRREPLMRLSILANRNLGAANLAQLLLGAAWIPMWFYLNLYLQQVLGYSAFPSGAALLPMTILIMIGMIALAPRVIARYGPKAPLVTGLAVLAAGLGWLALIRPTGGYLTDVLPASPVSALGMAPPESPPPPSSPRSPSPAGSPRRSPPKPKPHRQPDDPPGLSRNLRRAAQRAARRSAAYGEPSPASRKGRTRPSSSGPRRSYEEP